MAPLWSLPPSCVPRSPGTPSIPPPTLPPLEHPPTISPSILPSLPPLPHLEHPPSIPPSIPPSTLPPPLPWSTLPPALPPSLLSSLLPSLPPLEHLLSLPPLNPLPLFPGVPPALPARPWSFAPLSPTVLRCMGPTKMLRCHGEWVSGEVGRLLRVSSTPGLGWPLGSWRSVSRVTQRRAWHWEQMSDQLKRLASGGSFMTWTSQSQVAAQPPGGVTRGPAREGVHTPIQGTGRQGPCPTRLERHGMWSCGLTWTLW